MTVDILSSIKGAQSSEAVNKLFEVIKTANLNSNSSFNQDHNNSVSLDNLRDDVVIESSAIEKLVEMHPMRQVAWASVIQVCVFGFMLLAFTIIDYYIS